MEISMKLVVAAFSMVIGLVAESQPVPLPSNYQVRFENAWVKVTAVRYEPREKIAGHAHTPNASAYVYLNDGPPVIFKHVGGKPATRPATKAGAFRVYRGLEEVHEVENTGDVASEFLRIEMKTTTADQAMFWGKQERPAAASAEPVVQFNHAQVRISRLWVLPNQEVLLTAATQPALLVALAAGTGLTVGETRWLDTATSVRLKNAATAPVDLLRFDLRTRPRDTQ
jgi:hypothetical protein